MAPNEGYKKALRKTEEGLDSRHTRHGKQVHQRMKPYLILEYLMRETDEDAADYEGEAAHVRSANEIADYLEESFGIFADRRAIYKDVDEINRILYMLDSKDEEEEYLHIKDVDKEFEKAKEEGYLSELQTIIYDKKQKGFYVKSRRYELNDIRLLAECVYAARFIDDKRAKKLANVALSHLSEAQARKISHDSFLVDRAKTTNTSVYYSVDTINGAIERKKKISFKYLKYSINDLSKQAACRGGQKYVVSPFMLLINDGNYYLLSNSDKDQGMRTYRVDRMKEVSELNEPWDGEHEFRTMDIRTYTQRTFGMFGGDRKGVTLRFINPLLDTVIDRFGTKGARYAKDDEGHFRVDVDVEISDQFFGWLLGFGNKVKIMGPESAITSFTEYLDKVRCMY